jgi:hypothetical protein
LDFCIESKGTDLPFKTCAPYALELCQQSYLFGSSGLTSSFKKMMSFFAGQKEADYSIALSLKFAAKVLRHGPKAVSNFEDQYNFAISQAMKLPQKVAIELAMRVAENTLGSELK